MQTVFENYTASFEIDKKRIELSLWDTSGKSTFLVGAVWGKRINGFGFDVFPWYIYNADNWVRIRMFVSYFLFIEYLHLLKMFGILTATVSLFMVVRRAGRGSLPVTMM